MRIMIDTNVLISVMLFPSSQMSKLMLKATENHTLVLCSYIIDELHDVFNEKFKDRRDILEKFLSKLSYEICYTPEEYDFTKFPRIRDKEDYPIIASAILGDVDLLITGDKDFFDSVIERPEILSPKDFLDIY